MSHPASATAPSCCAGLRQTLIHGWQQDFPLHPSPFRLMAARSGATPRELIAVCRELQQRGALLPVRVRWGPMLRREHWRLAFDAPAGFTRALAALPGCYRIEHAPASNPSTWAEIEVLEEAALQRQLERLPQPPVARLRLRVLPADATLCCDHPQLAASVEQGLPLSAKPFADCGKQLGCSEHRVLAHLGAWRRSGQIDGLVLKPPPPPVAQAGLLALWEGLQPDTALRDWLHAQHDVDRVVQGAGTADWPWRLSVVLRTTTQLEAQPWRERLAETALAPAPDHCLPLRIEQPRDQGLLFSG
ncbi:hypothetical protein [Roseateles sp. BYS96W]|uniref:Siroheme decarboxylase NirL-like HTH domain-containing protein n=1 Tax=Pelomonas nitida TaxID=3299027 RepID=A0ABW7GCR9_9BURK